MYRTETARRHLHLLEQWDAWEFHPAPLLPPGDCRRLAHRFLGPQLVRDLMDERDHLLRRSRRAGGPEYGPGLTCHDVRRWLAGVAPANAVPDALVDPATAPLVTAGAADAPWLQIHRWLWRECLVRSLTGSAARTAGYGHARSLFCGPATIPHPPGVQSPCTLRTSPTHQPWGRIAPDRDAEAAFDLWWDAVAATLTGHLGTLNQPRQWGGRVLRRLFCPADVDWRNCRCRLYWLLGAKNVQWSNCRWHLPAEVATLGAVAGQLLHAVETGPADWDAAQATAVQALDAWALAQGMAQPPQMPAMPTPGQGVLTQNEARALRAYVSAVLSAYSAHGGPSHARYPQDVFSHHNPLPFPAWISETAGYRI